MRRTARTAPLALVALGTALAFALPSPDAGLVWPSAVGCAVALALLAARRRYAVFALRIALAIPLLAGGVLFQGGPLLLRALGVAWVAGGAGLAFGFLTPWTGLYAALAFALVLPAGGGLGWMGLAIAAIGVAFADDDTLSVDALLARRGGLFPTVRHEVVLARRR